MSLKKPFTVRDLDKGVAGRNKSERYPSLIVIELAVNDILQKVSSKKLSWWQDLLLSLTSFVEDSVSMDLSELPPCRLLACLLETLISRYIQ